MFTTLLLTAATVFTSLVAAQNYSTSGPISVVPSSVDPSLRNVWCSAQRTVCPQICGVAANPNTCDPDTLMYTCTCTDGSKPNISDYQNSLPWWECMQWKIDCTAAHPNDLPGQQACQSVTCGMKNATANSGSGSGGSGSSASSAAASMSMSMTASSSGAASSMPATTSSGGGASMSSAAPQSTNSPGAAPAVVVVGGSYGVGILSAVLLGLFGFAL